MAVGVFVRIAPRIACGATFAVVAWVIGDRLGGIVGDGILRRYVP